MGKIKELIQELEKELFGFEQESEKRRVAIKSLRQVCPHTKCESHGHDSHYKYEKCSECGECFKV